MDNEISESDIGMQEAGVGSNLASSGEKKKLKLGRMPALDGVRGFMVIAVTFYHGGFPGTGGYYLSLDGFFVLSGYLITTLLLMDVRSLGTVDFARFWSRRARRLLPALIVLVATILVVNLIFGSPDSHVTIRGDALAALFYASNWYYIVVHSGYFGAAAGVSPLQHTWSLAIEEQFYLVWPLVVFAVLWFRRSLWPLLCVCVGGYIASAITMSMVFNHGLGVNHAYFGTDSRAQALLAGCGLAVILAKWKVASSKKGKVALNVLATFSTVTLITLWSLASGPAPWAFHGAFSATDLCVATVIAATVIVPQGIFARVLSIWPLRMAGEISYGWYLWQFPIDQWLNASNTGFSGIPLFLIRSAAGLLMASLSYRFVEQPVRRGIVIRKWRAYVVTPVSILAVALVAVLVGDIPINTAYAGPSTYTPVISAAQKANPIRMLLVGDSLAFSLGYGVGNVAPTYGYKVYDDALIGCGVIYQGIIDDRGAIGPQASGSSTCIDWQQEYKQDIYLDSPDVSVLLVGRWECLDRNFGNGWEHIGQSDFDKRLVIALNQAIAVLHTNNTPVILLTAPYYDQGVQPNGLPWPEDTPSRVVAFNSILRQVVQSSHGVAHLVDFGKYISPNNQFAQEMNGIQIRTSDGVHMTIPGGEMVAPWLFSQINPIAEPYYLKRGGAPLTTIPGSNSTVPTIAINPTTTAK
ncbi:MAG: acyltransferase [Acidimicrobiales bacterium]|nr:acyltransferase [Acidimicrobiales bacterium]